MTARLEMTPRTVSRSWDQTQSPTKWEHQQSFGPRREKTCFRWLANNKGADQPAHPHSLISAFVIRLSESIICRLVTSEILIFYLVSVAE